MDWITIIGGLIALFAVICIWEWIRGLLEKSRKYDTLKPRLDTLDKDTIQFNKNKEALERSIREEKEAIQHIIAEKTQGFRWLATAFADYYALEDEKIARDLERKKRPALKEATRIKEIAAQKRVIEKERRIYKYLIDAYEHAFPWLLEFREYSEDDIQQLLHPDKNEDMTEISEGEYLARNNLLSPQDYQRLSDTEKFQRALDKYWHRNKSNWEVGRDYERYIGWLYEKEGYEVIYHGISEGFADLGRDLIAKKKNNIKIIQCKRWAQHKDIHEKHIFHLFGSTVEYRIATFPEDDFFTPRNTDLFDMQVVQGVFITTTSLSDKARQFAKALRIDVKEVPMPQHYPCIKCNIARDGEKIYHLPFDQQYDTARIRPSIGECYVATVEEAEAKGFRRAFRWKGNLKDTASSAV